MTNKISLCDALFDFEEASAILHDHSLPLQAKWANALALLQCPYPGIGPEELHEALGRLQTQLTKKSPLEPSQFSSVIHDVDLIVVLLRNEANSIKHRIAEVQHQISALQTKVGIELHRLSNALLLRIDKRMTASEFHFIHEFATTFFKAASEEELRLFEEISRLQHKAFGKA